MPSPHSIRAAIAALALTVPLGAAAQPPPPLPPLQAPGATTFTIFLRGAPIGTEQVAVTRGADGWNIISSGRLAAPLDVVARRVQARYTPEWRPIEFTFDGTVRGQAQTIRTIVEGTAATSDIVILSSVWNDWSEPNDSRKTGSDVPNQVLHRKFEQVGVYGNGLYQLWIKRR